MIRDNKPRAEMLYHSPLSLVVLASRTCRDSMERSDSEIGLDVIGEKDKKLISERILGEGKKYNPLKPPHESVLEHLVYTFLCRFSRDVLQELSRHRIASESVQSTRMCLGKLLKGPLDEDRLRKFLHQIEPEDLGIKPDDINYDEGGAEEINRANIKQLRYAIEQKYRGVPNDVVKYLLPGAFMTEAVFTINARSLRNFFALRTGSSALKEIRQLAFQMLRAIPLTHRFIFEDRIHWQHCPWVWVTER